MVYSARNLLIPCTVLFALTLYWQFNSHLAAREDFHLGVWTCETGPPGNRLHFWYEEAESSTRLARVFDGHVKIDGLWNMAAAEGNWNIGYWEPLIINLVIEKESSFAAIKKLDERHLMVRYATDCEKLLHDPFDHPDALHFRRVSEDAH